MIVDTLQAAIERVKKSSSAPHFLTAKDVLADKNVLYLRCHRDVPGHPYVATFATVVGLTPAGRVKLYLYDSGTTLAYADLQAVFTKDSPWCRGEPTFSHSICTTSMKGIVSWKRHRYAKQYPKQLSAEEVEQRVEQDWNRDATSFTKEE